MRTLTKGPQPEVLNNRAAEWTQEYADAVASGANRPTRWRHDQIVAALREETHRKCAYCESLIAHVAYPHVEHMRPKSARPDLVVEWANLTLSCPTCNVEKGEYYDEGAPLIHPYEQGVEDHVAFRGPMITARLGSDLGKRAIERLKLQREELFAERMKRIEALHELLDRWDRAAGADKSMYADLIKAAVGEDREYSSCLREYAAGMGFSF